VSAKCGIIEDVLPYINTYLFITHLSFNFPRPPMSNAPVAPLKKQRLIALAVSLVSCIIGGSIGLNALIKFVSYLSFVPPHQSPHNLQVNIIPLSRSNQAQIDIQAKVPSGVTVHLRNTGNSATLIPSLHLSNPLPTQISMWLA
jgi:hypothetical protein